MTATVASGHANQGEPPVTIVTGGAGGIGAGIVETLRAAGHAVVVVDRPEHDVTVADDVERVVAETITSFGRVSGLVNNAAIGPLGTILDTDEPTWDAIMAVNVKGPYLMSRAVLPHLIAAGGGAIVNIGSGAGHGKPNMAAYAASKGGLFALSAAMAYDHFHDRVRVNTVVPGGGGIPTGISLSRFGGSADDYKVASAYRFGRRSRCRPRRRRRRRRVPPLGRSGGDHRNGHRRRSDRQSGWSGAPEAGTVSSRRRGQPLLALRADVEDFLSYEAELLDERRFGEWLDLLTDDIVYFVPMRRNVAVGATGDRENTREGADISWFEDDKWTLTKRVEQIETGVHWAEEPLSRTTHVVTNVRVVEAGPTLEAATEVTVRCRFLVYQNRVEYEEYFFVGKRTDTLRRDDPSAEWQVARREVVLDQNVLLAKNLTVFL